MKLRLVRQLRFCFKIFLCVPDTVDVFLSFNILQLNCFNVLNCKNNKYNHVHIYDVLAQVIVYNLALVGAGETGFVFFLGKIWQIRLSINYCG